MAAPDITGVLQTLMLAASPHARKNIRRMPIVKPLEMRKLAGLFDRAGGKAACVNMIVKNRLSSSEIALPIMPSIRLSLYMDRTPL